MAEFNDVESFVLNFEQVAVEFVVKHTTNMETYKKPVVASKTGGTLILSVNSLIRVSAAPPDDNLQKTNSRALTERKDFTAK